jgi:hypothetical protein
MQFSRSERSFMSQKFIEIADCLWYKVAELEIELCEIFVNEMSIKLWKSRKNCSFWSLSDLNQSLQWWCIMNSSAFSEM